MTSLRRVRLWGRVLSGGAELGPLRLEVDDGRIVGLTEAERPRLDDLAVEQGWIAPGLIDLQVNGAGGVDLTSAAQPGAALQTVARTLVQHGVTSFCPTVVSSPKELILNRLAAYAPQGLPRAATSLGAHIEGPFIDPAHRGVHDPNVLRVASPAEIDEWLAAGPPSIVTLAPECPGGGEAISRLAAAGVAVSLGHSGATAAQARAGLQAGARMGTHLFNAMPPLHHRAPGLVGALLASQAGVGLIADGMHVDPLLVGLVVRLAGSNRVALVSDALAPAGGMPGESVLGEQTVISDGRVVRRTDGTMAGSAVLLDTCLRNVRAWLPDLAPATLLDMATRTPADLLGQGRKGRIAVGCDADLVVLEPDFSVRMTFVAGQLVACRAAG